MSKEVTPSELVPKILTGLNFQQIAVEVISLVDDVNKTVAIVKRISEDLEKNFARYAKETGALSTTTPANLYKTGVALLDGQMNRVNLTQRDIAGHYTAGWTMAAKMLAVELQNYLTFNNTDLWTSIVLDMPQQIAKRQAWRYWNDKARPNIPDERTAFQWLGHKKISRAEYNTAMAELGWSEKSIEAMYDISTTNPGLDFGFSMYKRGLLDLDQLKGIFSVNGYDPAWNTILLSALHRIPTLRELSQMSDYIPMPETYIYSTLQKQGYSDADALQISDYLSKRPLREEVRNVTGRILWDLQLGRIDHDTAESMLADLGILSVERELLLQWGDMRYADELIDEALTVIEQKVKNGHPDFQTEDDIMDAVLALGIGAEKANLIAEKLYYQYVYSPT